MTVVDRPAPGPAPAGRPVRAGAGRAHLPHLGADLRLQPGLRALPVQLGPARPARAHHRGVQGAHRRVRADADLLRQHRRRRAHHPVRLLGAGGLRHRPPRRGQVLDQRFADHRRGGRPAGRQRLRRRPDLPRRGHRRGQRRRARRRLLRHRGHRHGAPGRSRLRRVQALGGGHPPQRRPARRLQGPGRPVRGPAPPHPAAAVGPGGRRVGRAPPDRRPAAGPLRLAGGPRRGRAHRRLVLPPGRRTATPLPGLNLCGAGRVVCLVDPVGDVYACPFAIHDEFLAGNVRSPGGFTSVWRESDLFAELRRAAERGRLRVVRSLRRLPGRVHGGQVLHRPAARRARPRVRARPRRARPGRPRATPSRPGRRSTTRRRPAPGTGGPVPAPPAGPAGATRAPWPGSSPPPAAD